MILSLVEAGGSAICYGVASVLQAVAVRRNEQPELELQLLRRLFRELPYLAGLGLDLGGFGLGVIALHRLPLFVVQSAIAANIGVTAVAEMLVFKTRVRASEVRALLMLGIGLALLMFAAKAGPSHPLPQSGRWVLLACLPVVAVVAGTAARRTTDRSAIGLAAVAGAGFGAVGIAARTLRMPHPWWHIVIAPEAWAIAGFGAVGAIAFAAALQRGSVTVAAAVMSSVETVVPSVVGLAVLGDATRSGFGRPVAAAGFALTLAGVFLLTPATKSVSAAITRQGTPSGRR